MRRNTARIGDKKSIVLPPPRIIGSVRHAITGLISPSTVPIVPAGQVALALSACHKDNQDVVNNVELNQPSPDQLNELANQAAMDAANAAAAAQANMHAEEQNATLNVDNPSDAEEQNVSGM